MKEFDSAEAFRLIDRREAHGRAITHILKQQQARLQGLQETCRLDVYSKTAFYVTCLAVEGVENAVLKVRQSLLDRTDERIQAFRVDLIEWDMQEEIDALTADSTSQE